MSFAQMSLHANVTQAYFQCIQLCWISTRLIMISLFQLVERIRVKKEEKSYRLKFKWLKKNVWLTTWYFHCIQSSTLTDMKCWYTILTTLTFHFLSHSKISLLTFDYHYLLYTWFSVLNYFRVICCNDSKFCWQRRSRFWSQCRQRTGPGRALETLRQCQW